MSDEHSSWGIEPVPDPLRLFGFLDSTLLWGNLGVSLLVIVAGAALVPALSLPDALDMMVVVTGDLAWRLPDSLLADAAGQLAQALARATAANAAATNAAPARPSSRWQRTRQARRHAG